MIGTSKKTAPNRMILIASVPAKSFRRFRTSTAIRIAPAVTKPWIVLDCGKRWINVAEFLPDALDEGAHIGAEADLAFAGGEARTVDDVIELAIADVLPSATHQILDDAEFGQGQVDALVLPKGAVHVAAQMDAALLHHQRLAPLPLRRVPAFGAVDDQLDAARHDLEAARLFDEVDSSAQETCFFVDLIAENGQKHDRHLDLLPAQFAQYFDAGHAGHLPVEQDAVRYVRLGEMS